MSTDAESLKRAIDAFDRGDGPVMNACRRDVVEWLRELAKLRAWLEKQPIKKIRWDK